MKNPHYLIRNLVTLILALLLAACDSGDGDGDGLTISGSVTMPAGVDVAQTLVDACDFDVLGNVSTCNFASPNTQTIAIEETGTTASFRFTSLREESYLLQARKFEGRWLEYAVADCNPGGDGFCRYFEPPLDNVSLNLVPVTEDFRVEITAPSGISPVGSEVGFCVVDDTQEQACVEELSVASIADTPPEPGEIYGYQYVFPQQPEPVYVLLAGKDVNGNGEWDYWGCYFRPGDLNCSEVEPGTREVFRINMLEQELDPPTPYPMSGNQPAMRTNAEVRSTRSVRTGIKGGTAR